jgi:hypothetical protein
VQLISADGGHLLVTDATGALRRMAIGGTPEPVHGFESGADRGESLAHDGWASRDTLLAWSPDLKSVTAADERNIPVVVSKVNLDTGARTKIIELTPRNPSGMLFMTLQAFRDNGAQYVYSYQKRVSALYLVNGLR